MSGCCATLPLAKCPTGIYAPDFQLPVVNAPQNWQPVALDNITLAFPHDQNQPSLQPNGQMIAGEMIQNPMVQPQPQQQLDVEMAQISQPTQNTEYNQNYFQNYNK